MRSQSITSRMLSLALLAPIFFLACGQEMLPPDSAPALSASQMKASLSDALFDEDPVNRIKTLSAALERLDATNVEGAAEAFASNRMRATPFDIHPFMSRWATFDPTGAMDFATEGLKEGRPRAQGYKSIVFSWVRSGRAEEAFAFGEQLKAEGSPLSQMFQSNLIHSLIVNRNFTVAMPLLEAMPEGTDRNALLLGLTFDLANKGVPYLLDWTDSVSVDAPNNLKGAVFAQTIQIVAKSDPELAAAWYEREGYQNFVPGATMAFIVVEWITYDPVAAMEWAIAQPPSDDRDAAVRGAVYRWQMEDSETSEPWLREHLSDPAMAVAIYPFAQWLVYENPVEALAWGLRVPDISERQYVIQQSFLRWRREDPESAMDWFENTELAPELRREIEGLIALEGNNRVVVPAAANETVAEEAEVSGQP